MADTQAAHIDKARVKVKKEEKELSPEELKAQQQKIIDDLFEKIRYSDNYSDDAYTYRHVTLPKQLLRIIPEQFWNTDQSGTLRLLTEDECRIIGIQQSHGWEHYGIHAPEPNILLFRRPLGTYQSRQ